MILEIFSKIASESLLSLYPVFVKHIRLDIALQLWSRFFTYVFFSAFFVDWDTVLTHLFSKTGLALAAVTMIHVFSSYKGFLGLESGLAYTLFYIYPLLILWMSGEPLQTPLILVVFGILLLCSPQLLQKSPETSWTAYVMIAIAAFTEALIYFLVRKIKTENNWNHVFLSYFWGAIGLSLWNNESIISMASPLSWAFAINMVIGLFGYLLRFYAASRLEPSIYAPLSYVGIVMAYVYGFVFSGEPVTWLKMVGTALIVAGAYGSSKV
jgi:drug/metabolite transporter (DMT)-like permease